MRHERITEQLTTHAVSSTSCVELAIRDVFLNAPHKSRKILCKRARRCTSWRSVRRPIDEIDFSENSYAYRARIASGTRRAQLEESRPCPWLSKTLWG